MGTEHTHKTQRFYDPSDPSTFPTPVPVAGGSYTPLHIMGNTLGVQKPENNMLGEGWCLRFDPQCVFDRLEISIYLLPCILSCIDSIGELF